MDKMRMEAPGMAERNIDKIEELFPNCVTEALDEERSAPGRKAYKKAINFEMLRQMLSEDVAEGGEAYELTWAGKKASVAEANRPVKKTLRPCPEESVDWDSTENIYIEGDNLDVLKILQESYLGKVRAVYIDPPYNTGGDFLYRDRFSRDGGEYAEGIGQVDGEGNRLFRNTDSNGRFHSDWCSMIYPRLLLARDLLSDDGVIFISIDDNERENLRKICDEVFGRDNFICTFVWNTKKAAQGMATANGVVCNHEYIVVYGKKASRFRFRGLDRDEGDGFANPDRDPRGPWKRQYLQRLGQGLPERTIRDPETGNTFTFETPYTQEKLDRWVLEGRILFPKDPSRYPARKEFLSEYGSRRQLVTGLGLHATKSATERLYALFDGAKVFPSPKPEELVKFCLGQALDEGIVMDFFSGSATTAHAVMQLNAEDNGRRRFILVQLPEPCDEKSEAYKAGYGNICEIGKERIRRAGAKIREEYRTAAGLDVGFRVFKLDEGNMEDAYYAAGEYDQEMLSRLESNIKPGRTGLDLLFGCLLEWGLPLSVPYASEQIGGCTAHVCNGGELIACFDEDIPESVIRAIAGRRPQRAVFRDSGFPSSAAKINAGEIFKALAPDASVKVL